MEVGTDIDSIWDFNEKKDLILVNDVDNLIQAIQNRLSSQTDSLDVFYDDYGSLLTNFLGWRKTDKTLAYLKIDIENRLKAEPRLKDFTVQCSYNPDNSVKIEIETYINEELNKMNFILTDDGVEVE